MLYTGSYTNFMDDERGISISGDKGKQVNYQGDYYKKLAPKYDFWKKWHDNIGKISDKENNLFYVSSYVNNVLYNLDATNVLLKLNERILLCYEESYDFCHRHIVACWLEDELGMMVPELSRNSYGEIVYLERPKYIDNLYKKAKTLKK